VNSPKLQIPQGPDLVAILNGYLLGGATMVGLFIKMGGRTAPGTPRIDYDFGMPGFFVVRGDFA